MREERRPSDPSSVSVKRGNIFDLVALDTNWGLDSRFCPLTVSYYELFHFEDCREVCNNDRVRRDKATFRCSVLINGKTVGSVRSMVNILDI